MNQPTIPAATAALLLEALQQHAKTQFSAEQISALEQLARFTPAPALRRAALPVEELGDGDSGDTGCDTQPSNPGDSVDTGPSTDVTTDQTVDSNWPPLGSGDVTTDVTTDQTVDSNWPPLGSGDTGTGDTGTGTGDTGTGTGDTGTGTGDTGTGTGDTGTGDTGTGDTGSGDAGDGGGGGGGGGYWF